MRFLSFLRFPLFHKNGVAQQDQVKPVEILQPEVPTLHPKKYERLDLIESLEELEKFVLASLGVADALVSVKMNAERMRFINIRVRPTDRYKKKGPFRKLKRRISKTVASYSGVPQPQIQVGRMKNSNPHAPSPDPPPLP